MNWKLKAVRLGNKVLGFFLPSYLREGSERTRAYISVGSLLIATIFEIVNVSSFLFVPPRAVILVANLGLLSVSLVCLIAVKKGFPTGQVVPFFVGGYTIILSLVSAEVGSFIAPGMYFFIVFLMYGALLSLSRWTIMQSLLVVSCTVLLFTRLHEFGASIPWGWELDDYLKRMRSVVFILCFCSYFCMIVQYYFRRQVHSLLRRERQKSQKQHRFFALTSLTDTLNEQLITPAERLRKELDALAHSSSLDSAALAKVEGTVESLIRISKSLNLLYDPSHRVSQTRYSIHSLFEHLDLVLRKSFSKQQVRLSFESSAAQGRLEGPIATLATVLSGLAKKLIDKKRGALHLRIALEAIGDRYAFRLTLESQRQVWEWMLPNLDREDLAQLEKRMTDEFLEGLIETFEGRLEWGQSQGVDSVLIFGNWVYSDLPKEA